MNRMKAAKVVVVHGDTVIHGPMPEPGSWMQVASKSADDVRVVLEEGPEFTIPKERPIGYSFAYCPPYGWLELI